MHMMRKAGEELSARFAADLDRAQAADRQRGKVLPMARAAVRWDFRGPRGARVVALVAAGKPARPGTGPARAVYDAPIVRAGLALAELVADRTWLVTGTRGAIDPDDVVSGADADVRRHPLRSREAWAREIVHDVILGDTLYSEPSLRVVLLAPRPIAAPIVALINDERERSTRWETPVDLLSGLGSAERLFFLREATKIARGARR